MTDNTTLPTRLREIARALRDNTIYTQDGGILRLIATADECGEAADRIEALEAENARLRGALKPFADIDLTSDQLGSEFAWDVLRAREAIAKARGEG